MFERRDALRRACEESGISRSATRLDELRSGQIGGVHEEIRNEPGERAALVRSGDEHTSDAKIRRADAEPGADVTAERREQPRVRPYFSRRGDRRSWHSLGEGSIRHHHRAAQRVPVRHGIDVRELTLITLEYHAEETGGTRGHKAALAGCRHIRFLDGLRRLQSDVGGEYLARLHRHRGADPAHQEADARESCHRDGQREKEDAELAGAPFPGQHAHREPDYAHPGYLSPPASMCTIRSQRVARSLS